VVVLVLAAVVDITLGVFMGNIVVRGRVVPVAGKFFRIASNMGWHFARGEADVWCEPIVGGKLYSVGTVVWVEEPCYWVKGEAVWGRGPVLPDGSVSCCNFSNYRTVLEVVGVSEVGLFRFSSDDEMHEELRRRGLPYMSLVGAEAYYRPCWEFSFSGIGFREEIPVYRYEVRRLGV